MHVPFWQLSGVQQVAVVPLPQHMSPGLQHWPLHPTLRGASAASFSKLNGLGQQRPFTQLDGSQQVASMVCLPQQIWPFSQHVVLISPQHSTSGGQHDPPVPFLPWLVYPQHFSPGLQQ